MTYPSGRVIQYDYDSVGNTVSLHDNDLDITTMQYNAMNQIAEIALNNEVSMSYDYDSFGRLLSSKIQNEEVSLFERGYQYNGAEEIIKRTLKVPGVQDVSHDFTYNKDSQIMSQQESNSNDALHEFGYALTGELTAINTVEQEYDVAGKLLTSGSSDFSYDSRNNRTKMENMTDSVEYSWNESNMLSEATVSSGDEESSVQYMYGADGLLVSRSHNATEHEFVWDRNRDIPVLLSDGEYEYIYKNPTDRVPFAQINTDSGAIEYLHSDSNGSITAVFKDSGSTVETLEYDPYGQPNAELISNFGYAGEWTDNVTGYSFLRARWLDTETGNFLAEDPMVQVTMNAFGYTEGNPLSQIDPLGLFTMNEFGDWVHENSAGIGITLTTIGIGASMTGLGAPVGYVALSVGVAVNAYSAYRSYQEEDYSGIIMSAASIIPAGGFVGASLRNFYVRNNLDDLVNAGQIGSRYVRKRYHIPSRDEMKFHNNMGITSSITGNMYHSIKGENECV